MLELHKEWHNQIQFIKKHLSCLCLCTCHMSVCTVLLLSLPQKPRNGSLHLYPHISERGLVSAQFNLPADRVGGHGEVRLGVCVCRSSHALLLALLFHLDGHRGTPPLSTTDKGV